MLFRSENLAELVGVCQEFDEALDMAIAGIVLGWVSIAVLGALAIAWFSYNVSNG